MGWTLNGKEFGGGGPVWGPGSWDLDLLNFE